MSQGRAEPGRALVFLVGFMGSGKSTVGERLARILGWEFEDSDRRVEVVSGRSVEAIFRESGEGRFRGIEAGVLDDLALRERCVVATGGGLFLGRSQRHLMKRVGWTIWLDLPLNGVRERLGGGRGRPLWDDGDPVELRAVFEKRRASYALAHRRVGAAGSGPERIAKKIASFFVDSGWKLVIEERDRQRSWEDDS